MNLYAFSPPPRGLFLTMLLLMFSYWSASGVTGYEAAQAYLQALPVETDDQSIVADLLELEVAYRSNPIDYTLSDGDEAFLQLLAEDTLSATYTYSRALLGRLTGAQFHLPIAQDDTVEGLMQSNQNHLPASQLKESKEQISVIPNPAQDQVSVLLPGEPDANWTIDLFSAHGVGVKTLQVQGSQVEIKLQGLPSGLYFMRASKAGSGQSYQQQLIIR